MNSPYQGHRFRRTLASAHKLNYCRKYDTAEFSDRTRSFLAIRRLQAATGLSAAT